MMNKEEALAYGQKILEQMAPRNIDEIIATNMEIMSDAPSWQIVKEVANSEPGIPSEIDGSISCFYCGNYQYDDGNSKVEIDGLPHEKDCTYVKARALVAQKKEG